MKSLLLISVLVLAGCSSAPKTSKLFADQYCYTSQTIETKDGQSVSSRTRVDCSDDPAEKYVPARLGLAKDCTVVYIRMPHGMERVSACKKFGGHYDIVESRTIPQ
jgi:hypothetical protein